MDGGGILCGMLLLADLLVSIPLALLGALLAGRLYGLTRKQKAEAAIAFTVLMVPVRYAIFGLLGLLGLAALERSGSLEEWTGALLCLGPDFIACVLAGVLGGLLIARRYGLTGRQRRRVLIALPAAFTLARAGLSLSLWMLFSAVSWAPQLSSCSRRSSAVF